MSTHSTIPKNNIRGYIFMKLGPQPKNAILTGVAMFSK
jgi:hypothetical protein